MTATGLLAQQDCSYNYTTLTTSHQEAAFGTPGTGFFDGNTRTHRVPYTYTGSSNNHPGAVFASSPWLGMRDASGLNMVMAPQYLSYDEAYGQPLDALTGLPVRNDCSEYQQLWKASRWAVDRLIADYNDNGVIDNPVEQQLLEWPGRGNPHFTAQMGYTLPNQDLAPFYDQNGDGNYDPMDGDYPVYKAGVATAIAEEVLWSVFHSRDYGQFAPYVNNGGTMQVEVQQTVYALSCGGNFLLNRALFVHHKLINRASSTRYNVRYANWSDFDLGCYEDDYIGTDTSRNSLYAYNQDFYDDNPCSFSGTGGYGNNPPVQAVTFLNEKLVSAIYSISSSTDPKGDAQTAAEVQNLLSGVFKDGTPITPSRDGYNPTSTATPVSFVFPNNPTDFTAWTMVTQNLSGLDQRTIGTVYKDSLPAGAIWEIDLVYSYHRNPLLGPYQNVNIMEQGLDNLQSYYDNGLENISCPNCVLYDQLRLSW